MDLKREQSWSNSIPFPIALKSPLSPVFSVSLYLYLNVGRLDNFSDSFQSKEKSDFNN